MAPNLNLTNKFCSIKNLKTESDVEQFFLAPLLKELGYTDDYQKTKSHIVEEFIRKGKKGGYKPDYICYSDKQKSKPVLVIDAKNPNEDPSKGVTESQLYATILRRDLQEPKPIQLCIGSNGIRTIVKHYEENVPIGDLVFEDFNDGNQKYSAFKDRVSRSALSKMSVASNQSFEFKKPDLKELSKIFEKCHKLIWRKEVSSPHYAFYEFSKLMFVKLAHDKDLHSDIQIKKLIEGGQPLPLNKVRFSSHWISKNKSTHAKPINSIFTDLRDSLEKEIQKRRKKRIFEQTDEINLKQETIQSVVPLLEHFDFYDIGDDLNGRLFETFLNSTMRGKELGQFFTPRTVVEFMTKLADLKADRQHVDRVIDACCGTGGFLIEAMAIMVAKVKANLSLSGDEKTRLIKQITDSSLLGIDAGKDPPISRIARINMYLHGDGGSKVFFADGLDREMRIDETITPELTTEREELKQLFIEEKIKFDVALTNPPFAMSYSKKESDEKPILEQYSLAIKETGELKASLRSSVLFLQRYHDLLKEGGRLITIIDESILNTDTDKDCRKFIYDNYLVRAVISLPRMTFFRSGANVKTSILYLEKKKNSNDEQPHTFYARCENSGFDIRNLHKIDPTRTDLFEILTKLQEFMKSGKL